MEQEYLMHYGRKGMKWGQHIFGKARVSTGRSKAAASKQQKESETPEQTRARLLKSSDAKELYKNRHLLSTAEINERLNRIDTEKKLGAVAEQSKKGLRYYTNKASELSDSLNKLYQITETPLGKAIKNKLLGKEDVEVDLKDLNAVLKNKDNLSNQQLGDALKRANTLRAIKKLAGDDDGDSSQTKKSSSKSDDADSSQPKKSSDKINDGDSSTASKYSATNNKKYTATKKSAPDVDDDGSSATSKYTATKKSTSKPETVTGELIGKASSKTDTGSGSETKWWKQSNTYYDVPFEDVSPSTTSRGQSALSSVISSSNSIGSTPISGLLGSGSSSSNSVVALGQSAVAGLLEPPKDR